MYNGFVTASVERPRAELDQMLADINTAALEILDRPGGVSAFAGADAWRGETAALIREAVEQEFRLSDPTQYFLTRKGLEHGNSYEFTRLVNTFRVVEYAPGSDPEIFSPRKGKYTIKTASHQINWGIDLEALYNRQWDIATFVRFAAQAVVRHYTETGLTLINAATQTPFMGDPLRSVAAGEDVVKSELDFAIRRLKKYNAGTITIFGTGNSLYPIQDIAAQAGGDQSKEDLARRGVVGGFRGCRLVELKDEYNPYYESFTKVNGRDMSKYLFMSAGNTGGVFLEKDLSMLNWEVADARSARWEQGIRFEHGGLVHSPWMYHVIELAD